MTTTKRDTSLRSTTPVSAIALALAFFCWFSTPVWAQNGDTALSPEAGPVPGVSVGPVTADQVNAIIQELQTTQGIDEAVHAKVLELCQSALLRLETAGAHAANAAAYQQSIGAAPQEIERIGETLKQLSTQPPGTVSIELSAGASADELEQRLAKEQADQAVLKTRLADLEQQIKALQDRPEQARVQLAGAKTALLEIDKDLAKAPAVDEHELLSDARRAMLLARKLSRSNEVAMVEQELLSQPVRLGLVKAQRDLASRQLSLSGERVQKVQSAVNERRRVEADQARAEAEKARREAVGKHPQVRRLAEKNAELAKDQARLVSEIERAIADRRAIGEQLEKLEQQFAGDKEKLDIAGLTDALGPVLREQRKGLPDMRRYLKIAAERKKRMSESGLEYLRIEEERRELTDLQGRLQQILAQLDDAVPQQVDPVELEAQARKLLADRKTLLDQLAASYRRYLDELAGLNFDERQLVERANRYATFLDERLLWIPSTQPPGWGTLEDFWRAIHWLASPQRWAGAGGALWVDSVSAVLWMGLSVMVLLAMLVTRRRLRTQMEVYNGRVGTIYADSFWLTVGALVNVLLLAAPFPFVMGCMGWRLYGSIDATDFAKAVGSGLTAAAVLAFVLGILRELCRDRGVAQVHLHWRPELTALIRRSLLWFVPLGVVTGFVVALTESHPGGAYRSSLGRVAFVIGMVGFAGLIDRVFRGRQGIVRELARRRGNTWLPRLFWVWYPLLVGAPLGLVALAVAGYYYTAYELAQRLLATFGIAVTLSLIYALVMRWLFVARQKLEIARASERRAAAAASQEASERAPSAKEGVPDTLEAPHVTIEAISEHTRRLLRAVLVVALFAGLWLIWSPILPAFRLFDDVALWHQALMVDGEEVLQSVTVTDLIKAVLLAIVAAVAARNVPGVLELAVLQRLPLEPGSRYALATTCRYVITAIGVVLVFNTLGISWSKVQWLVAALGVGLGFGLQEIVANFVSGLIILFERPIRVGDTVTVGQVTGTVSRIQIRATTITDWDRKELIVPNKEFVTGQLINWSLSDSILRLVVRVGVAYGSDIDLTRKTMLSVAKKHPHVLKDPPPSLVFGEFGDSSLNFDLRVFVANVDTFIHVRNDLHTAIDKAFREAGIEIAFPQRDMHLDTSRPLEVRIIGEQAAPRAIEP